MTEGRATSSTAVLVCQGGQPPTAGMGWARFSDPVARELLDRADRLIVDRVRAGGRLVVNYQTKSLRTTVMRVAMRVVLRLSRQPDPLAGEPWRSLWRPDRMRSMLDDNGFEVTSDSDLHTLSEGLALPSDNDGSLRNGRVAVAVRR